MYTSASGFGFTVFNCSDGVYFFVFHFNSHVQKKKENQIRKYMNTKHM